MSKCTCHNCTFPNAICRSCGELRLLDIFGICVVCTINALPEPDRTEGLEKLQANMSRSTFKLSQSKPVAVDKLVFTTGELIRTPIGTYPVTDTYSGRHRVVVRVSEFLEQSFPYSQVVKLPEGSN